MITSKKSRAKTITVLSVAVIGAIFLNKYFIKGNIIFFPKSFVNLGNYLFAEAENLGGFTENLKNFNRLADENEKLKQERRTLLGFEAKVSNLESENDFLRRSARISQKQDRPVVDAGIFNVNLTPNGYNVLLNKGSNEGISEGDVVVTDGGILVGKVQKVMQNFSRVLFISDPKFKVTVKVLNSGTAGIARGALNDGMYLDFIVQEDEIKEGDSLVSTGSDLFPPALIVGSVDHVEINTTQMFKKVRIRPAVKDVKFGRVLVIKVK